MMAGPTPAQQANAGLLAGIAVVAAVVVISVFLTFSPLPSLSSTTTSMSGKVVKSTITTTAPPRIYVVIYDEIYVVINGNQTITSTSMRTSTSTGGT